MSQASRGSSVNWPTVYWWFARRFLVRSSRPSAFRSAEIGAGALGLTGLGTYYAGTLGLITVPQHFLLPASLLTVVVWVTIYLGRRFLLSITTPIVSVAVAVACLVSTRAVLSGVESQLHSRMSQVNAHFVITKYGLDFYEYPKVMGQLQSDPEVAGVGGFVHGIAMLLKVPPSDGGGSFGNSPQEPKVTAVRLKGIDPIQAAASPTTAVDTINSIRPASIDRLPTAVVGKKLAQRHRIQIGDTIKLVTASRPGTQMSKPKNGVFEVSDLLQTGVSDLDDRLVVVHLSAAQSLVQGRATVTGIEVWLNDPFTAQARAQAFESTLNEGRRNRLYRTSTWIEQNQSTRDLMSIARATSSILLGLILMVGTTSLVIAQLLSARRKQHHLALMMCLGAPRAMLSRLYVFLGLVVGGLGTAIGVLLAVVTVESLSRFQTSILSDVVDVPTIPTEYTLGDFAVPAVAAISLCILVSVPVARAVARNTNPLRLL